MACVGEALLEGISSIKSHCTPIGRNAMLADVQEALHSCKAMAPLHTAELAATYEVQARLIANYVKVRAQSPSLCVVRRSVGVGRQPHI